MAKRSEPIKGAIAGLIGGIAGTFAMNQYRTLWLKFDREGRHDWAKVEREQRAHASGTEAATSKAASAVAEVLIDRPLTQEEKRVAGPLTHYLTGGLPAAAYGIAVELQPKLGWGAGLPLGAIVFFLGDEVAVTGLRLSPPASEYTPSTHLYTLTSHTVYGLVTDGVRRLIRANL